MELAHLKIIASAEVDKAIDGLEKTQGALEKTADVSKVEGGKMEDFVEKYKMGWIAAGVAVAGVLYGIMKLSPVASGYFAEFTAILGFVADTIMVALAPALDILMYWLWKLADLFAEQDPLIHKIVGVLGILGAAIVTLIGIWAILPEFIKAKIMPILLKVKGFITTKIIPVFLTIAGIIKKVLMVAFGILGAKILIIIGIIALLYLAWQNNWFGIRDIVLAVWEQIKIAWDTLMTHAHDLRVWIVERFTEIKNRVYEIWNTILGHATTLWDNIKNTITTAIISAYNTVMQYVQMMIAAVARIPVVGGAIGGAVGAVGAVKGAVGFQHGGVVPWTGHHYLHKGERVVPAGAGETQNINITNTFNITGAGDPRRIADEVSRIMANEIRRAI